MKTNNANYLEQIFSDKNKNIENMSDIDLTLLYEKLINNPNDYKLLEKILDKTEICNQLKLTNIRNPPWFTNGTIFKSNIWEIKINKKTYKINFSQIIIDNDIYLTQIPQLLNTFKYWICIQGHPIYSNGLLLKPESIAINIKRIIHFINSILINSSKLKITTMHLKNINENIIIDYLIDIATTGQYNACLNYSENISNFLINKIKSINMNDVEIFENSYPLLPENQLEDELSLNIDEIRKSRYWLFNNEGYSKNSSGRHKRNIFLQAYQNKIIQFNQLPLTFPQLNLYTNEPNNEFLALPCRTNEELNFSYQDLQAHIKLLKTICFIHSQVDCAQININNFNEINIRRINKKISLRENGRFVTLPASVVFKSIKDSIEFIHQYIDIVLDTILKYAIFNKNNKDSFFEEFFNSDEFPEILKNLGIKQLEIIKDNNYFTNLRKNLGLFDFYNVLLGAILIAIGATTARRNSEILELDPLNCLLPNNIDPSLKTTYEFELIFDNRKSGIGGVNYHREKMARPINSFIANIIYKIQIFNKKITEESLADIKNIFLINIYSPTSNSWKKLSGSNYSYLLNLFCDYFETKVLEVSKDDFRRYYIRQHQLRRFFAMMFFWSKSFDGLDTLRYFLGHTDIEHLYHYITEPLTGSVLNGVKAHTLTEAYLGNSAPLIKNIESLRGVLLTHFNVNDLEILNSNTIINFDKPNSISNKINYLLDEHIIDLKPHFFTVLNEKNEKIQQFELILIVEDII